VEIKLGIWYLMDPCNKAQARESTECCNDENAFLEVKKATNRNPTQVIFHNYFSCDP